MDRTERVRVLAQAEPAAAIRLAERLLEGFDGEVALVAPPTVGMVMARVTDSAKGQVFNLGEVLVTEARVSLLGQEGWGMVMGGCAEHALAVAILDAGLEAGHRDAADIEAEIGRLEVALQGEVQQRWQTVAPTRVEFENF